jgi:prepilin peptidase CpaA
MEPATAGELMTMFISTIVIGIGIVACAFDIRTRRIPNVLTFSAALAGLLFHVVQAGAAGAQLAAGGWVVGLLLLLPYFALGGMGGGDVKLVAALGAWLGPSHAFWVAVYAGLVGGVFAVCLAITQGYLKTALSNVAAMLGYWATVGLRAVPGFTLESSKSPRLAYAIPILAATVMSLWLR